jgi:hypothetical protein
MRLIGLHRARFTLLAMAMVAFWFIFGFDSPQNQREERRNRWLFAVSMIVMVVGGLRYKA